MKKSHKWDEYSMIDVRCPNCGVWSVHEGEYVKGDRIYCPHCKETFELGQQK